MEKNSEASADKKINVLIYCPSDLILAGVLKSLETADDIEVSSVEKGTIDSFLESIKTIKPNVILFTNTDPLPNLREICKAIKEISEGRAKSQLLLLGNIPSHEDSRADECRGARLF